MVHDSLRNLQLDRRLLRRRGWIARDDLDQALEGLSDSADRAELVGDDEPPAEAEAKPEEA